MVPPTCLDTATGNSGSHALFLRRNLLGHEAVLGLQFLRRRLVFHGRRGWTGGMGLEQGQVPQAGMAQKLQGRSEQPHEWEEGAQDPGG